jgi:hypothetical protein
MGVKIKWAANVTPKSVDYLWRGRLARGKLTAIGGDPGIGKGMLGIDIAAHLSTGEPWPDGQPCPLGRVFLLTGEDDPEDTIRPRLDAHGADLTRVGLIGRVETPQGLRRVQFPDDIEPLLAQASAEAVDVIIIDPISSYYAAGIDTWRDPELRRVLDPLAEAAAKYKVAVVLVAHLNKSGGRKAIYRFQGSIASIAAARFGFLVAAPEDDPDLRIFAIVKGNLARPVRSLAFRIVPVIVESIADEIGKVEWIGESTLTADELVGEPPVGNALQRADDFLRELLAEGEMSSNEIKAKAKVAGVGRDPLWEAKGNLRIVARERVGDDGTKAWFWRLPHHPDAAPPSGSKTPSGSGSDGVGRYNSKMPPFPLSISSSLSMDTIRPSDIEGTVSDPDVCPACGVVDYRPLGAGRRQCLACGREW